MSLNKWVLKDISLYFTVSRLDPVKGIKFNQFLRMREGILVSRGIVPLGLNLDIGWRWVVSFTLWPLYLRERMPVPLNRRLCGLQSRSGHFGEKSVAPVGNRIVSSPQPWRASTLEWRKRNSVTVLCSLPSEHWSFRLNNVVVGWEWLNCDRLQSNPQSFLVRCCGLLRQIQNSWSLNSNQVRCSCNVSAVRFSQSTQMRNAMFMARTK